METDKANEIAALDYMGYKLADKQSDMTLYQKLFILDKGIKFRNEINNPNSGDNKPNPELMDIAREKRESFFSR